MSAAVVGALAGAISGVTVWFLGWFLPRPWEEPDPPNGDVIGPVLDWQPSDRQH